MIQITSLLKADERLRSFQEILDIRTDFKVKYFFISSVYALWTYVIKYTGPVAMISKLSQT